MTSRAQGPDPIPSRLNVVITLGSTTGCAALLWWASHAQSTLSLVAAAVCFSFLNNTVFSLLHEAVHNVLHHERRANEWLGRLVAAFFPTGLAFQRAAHLGHHQRNRTAAELFDYIRPGDNKLLKLTQWYGLLLGLFWVISLLGCALFLVAPGVLKSALLRGQSDLAQQTGADAMLAGFERHNQRRIRLEILGALLFQVALFLALDLNAVGWLACYGAFALHWCSLQYADHAWSPLDVREGAWNLRVNPVTRLFFLNYHDHLAHHQNPRVSWLYLPRYVDHERERPSFGAIYARMWLGPKTLDGSVPIPTPERSRES